MFHLKKRKKFLPKSETSIQIFFVNPGFSTLGEKVNNGLSTILDWGIMLKYS